jgi:hypothetical protein
MKTKETNKRGERAAPAPWPPLKREAAQKEKMPLGVGSLMRLDSAKEIKVNSFDFLWPGFAG